VREREEGVSSCCEFFQGLISEEEIAKPGPGTYVSYQDWKPKVKIIIAPSSPSYYYYYYCYYYCYYHPHHHDYSLQCVYYGDSPILLPFVPRAYDKFLFLVACRGSIGGL